MYYHTQGSKLVDQRKGSKEKDFERQPITQVYYSSFARNQWYETLLGTDDVSIIVAPSDLYLSTSNITCHFIRVLQDECYKQHVSNRISRLDGPVTLL